MKKLTFLALFLSAAVTLQSQAFEPSKSYISTGIGAGSLTRTLLKKLIKSSDYKFNSAGPFFLKYEYAVAEHIGLGLNFSYLDAGISKTDTFTEFNQTIEYTLALKYITWSTLLRVNFHFGQDEVWDPYIGLGMGYRSGRIRVEISNPRAPARHGTIPNFLPFGMELTLGSRFMFNDWLGAYAELGMAKGVVQAGLTAKF